MLQKTICGVAAAVLFAETATGGVESGLPPWNEGAHAGSETGDSPLTEKAQPYVVEPLDLAPPSAEEIATTAPPTVEIPEKFWAPYFGEHPQAFLVDPQGLLSAVESRDRLAFLKDHASDSLIDLFVYVFKGDQEIPGEVRAEELIERFFSTGRPAALVYYYMGTPQRSVLYLSPSLTDAVSVAEQRRALESSIMQAITQPDPSAQIDAFLIQMSIQIYWMERMVGGGVKARDGTRNPVKKAKAPEKKSAIWEKLRPQLESARRFAFPAEVLAAALVSGWVMSAWLRRRARYRFPEWNIEPRLGGAHAAGVGAVISFASAAGSPIAQRDQMPENRRRG